MILADYHCRAHGMFEQMVPGPASDGTPCPTCGEIAPWVPAPVRFKVAISATRGGIDRPEHKEWDFTANLEEGQSPDEWEADRDAAAERRREQFVVDAVKEGL